MDEVDYDEVKEKVGAAIKHVAGIKGFQKFMAKNNLGAFYVDANSAIAASKGCIDPGARNMPAKPVKITRLMTRGFISWKNSPTVAGFSATVSCVSACMICCVIRFYPCLSLPWLCLI